MQVSGVCSSCGELAKPAFSCSMCGAIVCRKCFDEDTSMCRRCAAQTRKGF